MSILFSLLMGVFILVANSLGLVTYRKKKSLYYAAFTILLSAVILGAIGGVIALIMIRDAFALFYGMQVGYYLVLNSVLVFLIAVFATILKR